MSEKSSSAAFALAAACLGFVVVSLDGTVANVALEDFRLSFGGDLSMLEWVLNAYTIAFAGFLLSAGAVSDRLGARRSYLAGSMIFLSASVYCGTAGSASGLIFARALQGIGAAAIVTASLALIAAGFPDRQRRSRAVAIWAMCGGSAMAAGPLIGGALLELAGWRAIFLINVPVLLAALYLGNLARGDPLENGRSFDALGQCFAIVTMASFTLALIEAGQRSFASPMVLAALAVAAAGLLLFLSLEKRRVDPMLPPALFASARFTVCCLAGFALNYGFYGMLFALSLRFRSLGFGAFETGLALLPLTLCISGANLVGGAMVARYGARVPILSGLGLASLGYVELSAGMGLGSYGWLIPGMFTIGAGSAIAVTALSAEALSVVESALAGIAGGTLTTARQLGGAFGVACYGILLGGADGVRDTARLQIALLAATAVVVAALVIGAKALPATETEA
ncbi:MULTISPECIES: MFS transporter [unclassified Sinorhizobium]|uniref:MFS transporter n=1 Tax=unclassified Sinorhizobium TaxID=2613772 RepID=UPI003526A719